MKIQCDKCKKILKEQGALIFSPPKVLSKVEEDYFNEIGYDCRVVRKVHLCLNCWKLLLKWIFI